MAEGHELVIGLVAVALDGLRTSGPLELSAQESVQPGKVIDEERCVMHDPRTVSMSTAPVPVFPLGGLYLFPHQVLPLHIFEPRYRQLIGDLLDGPGRLVIARPSRGERQTATHAPLLQPVAGLGEVMRHERLPDGRYNVWIVGLARVQITEVPSDRLYRMVRCQPFAEIHAEEHEDAVLARRLRVATTARLAQPLDLPESVPTDLLIDLLLQAMRASPRVIERAFGEPSVAERARYVLRIAARQPRNAGDGTGDTAP